MPSNSGYVTNRVVTWVPLMQQGHQLSTYNSRRSLVKEQLGFASAIRRKDRNTISEKQGPNNYQPALL
jgi:hypothetical protein